MVLKFVVKPEWSIDGVDIYVNGNMVGSIPKGVEKAKVRATDDRAPPGMDLFGFILEPNFETRILKVGIYNGEMEVDRYEIIDYKVDEISKK